MHAILCSKCARANVSKGCQFLILRCQRANKRAKGVAVFRSGVPMSQKARQFLTIFQKKTLFLCRIFQLCLTFANFKNIWEILENLSRETKNLNFDICKISSKKCKINFVVVEVVIILKTLYLVFMGA